MTLGALSSWMGDPLVVLSWKDLFESIYYVAATIAALGTLIAAVYALCVYRSNSRLERARWAATLYDKFYHEGALKQMRDLWIVWQMRTT